MDSGKRKSCYPAGFQLFAGQVGTAVPLNDWNVGFFSFLFFFFFHIWESLTKGQCLFSVLQSYSIVCSICDIRRFTSPRNLAALCNSSFENPINSRKGDRDGLAGFSACTHVGLSVPLSSLVTYLFFCPVLLSAVSHHLRKKHISSAVFETYIYVVNILLHLQKWENWWKSILKLWNRLWKIVLTRTSAETKV